MYQWIWITGAIGGITLLLALYHVAKDIAFKARTKGKSWTYLLPDWLLVFLSISWAALAIVLYLAIQMQLP